MQLLVLTALGTGISLPRSAAALGSAESDDGDTTIEVLGSQRLLGAFLHYRDMPEPFPQEDDGLLGSVTRILVSGSLSSVWSYEANLYVDLARLPPGALHGTFATAATTTSYRSEYLAWRFWEGETVHGTMGIDRLSFDALVEPLKLTVGRFPVNYSVTNLFTPNDFFAPFSPTAINTKYKPGVDALRLNLAVGALSSIELVRVIGYHPNDEPSWSRSALLARASTVLWDFEWAVLGGKLAERWVTGVSYQGAVGPINLRGEGHVGFADRDGDGALDSHDEPGSGRDDIQVRAAVGLDIPFEWHNANIAAEVAMLSDGATEPSDYLARAERWFPDDPITLGQQYVGLGVSGEIIPILRAALAGILNGQDQSGLVTGSLSYSIADEADFSAGVLVPWGERPRSEPPAVPPTLQSEYGIAPFTVYAETEFYF